MVDVDYSVKVAEVRGARGGAGSLALAQLEHQNELIQEHPACLSSAVALGPVATAVPGARSPFASSAVAAKALSSGTTSTSAHKAAPCRSIQEGARYRCWR
jgi:hypothetical protein